MSLRNKEEKDHPLVSEASLMLALAPPRAPPYDTVHRCCYTNQDPSNAYIPQHHESHYQHHNRAKDLHPSKQKRNEFVHGLLSKSHQLNNNRSAGLYHSHSHSHPHMSFSPESADQWTRYLGGHFLPLWFQNKYRDDGTFRSITDALVTCSVPALAIVNPNAVKEFIHLTTKFMMQIPYGSLHPSQKIDLFLPPNVKQTDMKGFVFFVHGGAWGSGMPWMYRLVASSFIKNGIAVAIVGYRTYPDGNVQEQINDLDDAAQILQMKYPFLWQNKETNSSNFGVCLMGHSSGAHVSLLLLIQQLEKKMMKTMQQTPNINVGVRFDMFVGLSGVYNIQHHFDYEAGRGVEEISPMKPACGYSREAFDHFSPAVKLKSLMSSCNEKGISTDIFMALNIPPLLFLHGMEDETVPYTSTSEAARIIRNCGASKCEEYYLGKTGHADVIMHFMLGGGRSSDVVMEWLNEIAHQQTSTKKTHSHKLMPSKL